MTPKEILSQIGTAPAVCFAEFAKSVRLADAFARTPFSGGEMAICMGPSGSGKSTLFNELQTSLFGPKETWPPGTKPVICRSLRNTNNAYFSSKWFIRALLTSVHDPFRSLSGAISDWELSPEARARLAAATATIGKIRDHEGDMQDAFVAIARAFQVKLILLDEGNMMCLTQRNRTPTDYLEVLRCMAQEIGCVVIIFGSCDLVDMLDYSGQMNRREFIVPMGRMHVVDDTWLSFLLKIESNLGITGEVLSGCVFR